MALLKKLALFALVALAAVIVGFNIWGYLTLGTLEPGADAARNPDANRVVMVFGATGSVGDGLLKAAMEDPDVEKIYAVSRRTSPRIDAGVASGEVELILHEDFTNYSALAEILGEVNTVMWGLGTSSLNVDDATYTWIHVDFPVAFVKQWLAARTDAPMSFHYVTGMGTDANGSEHWAREKGRAELEVAAMAEGTGLRTFGYRSAYIRPAADRVHAGHKFLAAILRPGALVIDGEDLGNAMLEISARSDELANGTLIDNADSIAYAKAHGE
ncbi:MAG: hypothetical protein KDI14_02890 [Halioglobus sp.]|nr:hypothetical protein [Halioglobus sp.]